MYYEMFPECYVQLQLEMRNHPLLIQRLQKHHNLGVEVIFAETCHYCSIAIDGDFSEEQMQKLADKLLDKLRTMKVLSAKPPETFTHRAEDWSKYYSPTRH